MLPTSSDALFSQLVRLRLLNDSDLTPDLKRAAASLDGQQTLALLERRLLLTSLQTERIRKGETDGLILGDYKLMYLNASGSFARVYRAVTISTGQTIGLKLLRERWSKEREFVQLFRKEGELGQKLKHPNIVPIHECKSEGRFHYITMEFVEGGSLKNFLKIRKKLSPVEATRYTLDIARGLQYALDKGFTHRDMKTSNVLLSSTGVAKLIDFGLASEDPNVAHQDAEAQATALEYSTIEKNTNAPSNDPRSDLFFLGGILFEMLTGQPPYPSTKNREERKRFGRYCQIPPVATLEPNLPYQLAGVVDRLQNINPDLRHQTPGELVFELEVILRELGDTSPAGRPVTSPVTANKSTQQSAPAAVKPKVAPPKATTAQKESAPDVTFAEGVPSVICLESRAKHQDVLREYFSRHPFSLALTADFPQTVKQHEKSSPDYVMVMGDVFGDGLTKEIAHLRDLNRSRDTNLIIVLGEKQAGLKGQLAADLPGVCIWQHPLTLRDLRARLTELHESRSR